MAQHDLETIAHTLERLTSGEKLALIEQLARSLRGGVLPPSPGHQRDALHRLQQELTLLPVSTPTDGWSNRDHDQLLYGDA